MASNVYIWDTSKNTSVYVMGILSKSTSETIRTTQEKSFEIVESHVLSKKIITKSNLDDTRATVYYNIDTSKDKTEFLHLDGFFCKKDDKGDESKKITISEEFANGKWATVEFKGLKKELRRVPKDLSGIKKWAEKENKKLGAYDKGELNLVEWYVKDDDIGVYSLGIYWRIIEN